MLTILKILDCKGFPDDLSVEDLGHLKFATITSVDVERRFSKFEYLLSDYDYNNTFKWFI